MTERVWYVDYDEAGNPTGVRMDKFALHRMETALDSGSHEEAALPVELFWQSWKPRWMRLFGEWPQGDFDENPPDLSPGDENEFLERLAALEHDRIPYTPDDEGFWGRTVEQWDAGSRYVHVAAASALRHFRRRDDFEYVMQTLREVRRVLYLLGLGPADSISIRDLSAHLDVVETSQDMISLWGIRSLIHAMLSNVRCIDGEYEEAFMLAADAVLLSDAVAEAVDPDGDIFKEMVGEDYSSQESRIRSEVHRCTPIFNMNPQDVVDTFEGIRFLGKSDNWRAIAFCCDAMVWHNREDLEIEEVQDSDGEKHNWPDYWNNAKGWATAQLSSNEYRALRRQDERDASEQRLRCYFFGDIWLNIPEKAREHLVNVDNLWFSAVRGTNLGSVLNDLQVAAETMCYHYVWEPLRHTQGSQALLEFKAKDAELEARGFFPTLADYAWACRRPFFKEFLNTAGLDREEQQFMVGKLQSALNALRRSRDDIQHNPSRRLSRMEVEPFVRRFLGIGQEGVLRRLVEIGPKLARR